MTSKLTIWTLKWGPAGNAGPRGFVRDLRLRWACEEAGFDYEVKSVDWQSPGHFARQPFGQVPFLDDGEIRMFESGACLLHLAKKSEKLMPRDARGRSDTKEWLFAGLNSVEMASLPWSLCMFSGQSPDNPIFQQFESFLKVSRLPHMEKVLATREWLAGPFTIADIVMADTLRLVDRFDGLKDFPAARAYVGHAAARPAFQKALADQMAHFAKAD